MERGSLISVKFAPISALPAAEVGVILGPGLDPAPFPFAEFAFPEPGGALEVIHAIIDRVDCPAAMQRRGRYADDRFARPHLADVPV